MKKVLLIEDNKEIQILAEAALESFQFKCVDTLTEATELLKKETFDLVVLDIELPDGDGLKFLASNPEGINPGQTPVFVLTSKSDVSNKIIAFSVGADDFIVKPFDPLEFKARVTAKIKKHSSRATYQDLITLGDVQISISKQKVWHVSEKEKFLMDLTGLEFKVLLLLSQHPHRIYSRDLILQEVWGDKVFINDRTVDTHIAHLRKKMNSTRIRIETVIGEGYRISL